MASPASGNRGHVPEHACEDFRDDPEYQLARAEYLFPDTADPDEKYALRVLAAMRMRDMEAAAKAR